MTALMVLATVTVAATSMVSLLAVLVAFLATVPTHAHRRDGGR